MLSILLPITPSICLLALGRLGRDELTAEMWKGVDRLNFHLLFPALVFVAAIKHSPDISDLATVGLGSWLILVLGCVLGWLARPLGPKKLLDFAGVWQTSYRFNTAFGLVVVQALPQEYWGYLSIAVGMSIPLSNIMAIWGLSVGQSLNWTASLRQIFVNPIFIASTLGITLAISGVELSPFIFAPIELLSQAAIPVALLSIGASLEARKLAQLDGFSGLMNAIKLLALPIITYVTATLCGLATGKVVILTLFAALPTSAASHIFASRYDADKDAVATIIGQSTLLGCFTVTCWLLFLSQL